MARVLVMMSGGVDSSVAAALVAEDGHDVTGVTLKLWGGETDSGCCSVADAEDARRVADRLGLPHYVFDLMDDFEAAVVQPYVDDHAAGRTPNPCVECNRSLKFGHLFDRALAMGFDAVATGHHARIVRDADGHAAVARGADPAKDQSYVLYMLGARELARTLLPIGDLTKAEVRAHAARLGLRTADKPESMDVCFVARRDRQPFLDARLTARPGAIVDTAGATIGSHAGVHTVTVGQRRGLGVAVGERRFVLDVDTATATVTVGTRDELQCERVPLDTIVDTRGRLVDGARVTAQMRAHGAPVDATLRLDVTDPSIGYLELDHPCPRVAPGQVVALYDGDIVLGGGTAR